MAETIRYARLGQEDINFGAGTFEVRLADGRVVTLNKVDLGVIISDAALSTRTLTLDSLTVTTLTPTTLAPSGTLQVPEKADPASPSSGEVWLNSGSTILEYADDQAVPAKHALIGDDTTQTLTNKTLTSPTITSPVLSGTVTGTYTLSGTITLNADFDLNGGDFTDIDELGLRDAATNPTASGRLRRNGVNLLFHDGTNAKLVILDSAVQTLSNKTLATPTITGTVGITNGTLTLPSATDTIVGRATTDTLTNKTLNGALVSGAAPATPTANTLYADSVVKAFVKFRIDGTIDGDLNVSSITDTGAGDWTVNWATAFADANYTVTATVQTTTAIFIVIAGGSTTNTSITTLSSGTTKADPAGDPRIHVMAIGNQ